MFRIKQDLCLWEMDVVFRLNLRPLFISVFKGCQQVLKRIFNSVIWRMNCKDQRCASLLLVINRLTKFSERSKESHCALMDSNARQLLSLMVNIFETQSHFLIGQ